MYLPWPLMDIKKPWAPSGSPMAPLTMQLGSGAWVSPFKTKKEEKEITEIHFSPFLNTSIYHIFPKSQGENEEDVRWAWR